MEKKISAGDYQSEHMYCYLQDIIMLVKTKEVDPYS